MENTVRLEPMTAEMYHTYLRDYENDPDLWIDKSKCTPYVYSPEQADRYIQRQADLGRKWFAILYGDELAGELILKNIEPHKCATLSVCMKNPDYKDRGIGTRAERLAVDYAFRELDIPVLYADSILSNTRSQHVLEKVGFRLLRTEGDFKYYCIERPAAPQAAPRKPRWIFFDLGSTLIDETEADRCRIEEMTAGTTVTPEAYREKRLELIRQGLPGDPAAITFFGLTKTPWHSELEQPWPDAAPVLAELQRRGFRLGVVANQEPGTEQRLAAWGLLQYFDVIAPSAELGVAKPDPAIFHWALDRAGCKASEAVMVGDRLDNDIAPAKRLGFRTVRVLRGLGVHHSPRSPDEEPDYTIRELAELLELYQAPDTP